MKSLASVAASDGFTFLRIDRLALLAVVSLALIVRFYAIDVPSIWYDEAYSLVLARETPTRIWALTALDVHPPLYYVLLHYWVLLWGEGALPARALSALADVGTLLLSIKLMSLIATRRATWIAALLLALLPISVRYSQEARMYALLGFWLMGATVVLICWIRQPGKRSYATLYVLLMTAAFYTHYFAGLCVLVHWLFWWQACREGPGGVSFLGWLSINGAIALLFVPWIPNLIQQFSGAANSWIEPVTIQAVLGLFWQFIVMDGTVAPSSLWRLLPLIMIVPCMLTILVQREKNKLRYGCLLITYFCVPVITLYLLTLITPIFVPRYLVFAAPALPMFMALALDLWGQRSALLSTTAFLLLVAAQTHGLLAVFQQIDELNGTEMRRDYRYGELVKEIQRRIRHGDQIVVGSLLSYLPFIYYSDMGIQPRFYVRSALDEFLPLVDSGGYALIPEQLRWIYFNDPTAFECRGHRIWWVGFKPASDTSTPFSADWKRMLTLHSGEATAMLFAKNQASASIEADDPGVLRQPPLPAAQNCPPAPSATSANRTRRSLPR
ncbi:MULTISPECIES: glycosyltransferase family 39 protein [unclassified Pseudomonas]|uniref:glycosyltransferase family 39 protein n=1 Tax=unclassified Pseudomonas TaxID=196821 RepID=UPI000A1DF860|nr:MULTISPECIES: glycosyltransferase family 39 protein [unclassified Pseudomonas]